MPLSAKPESAAMPRGADVDRVNRPGTNRQLQQQLDEQHRFSHLITALSSRMVSFADADVEHGMDDALRLIGEYLGVDRVNIAEADSGTFRVLHGWGAPGVTPIPKTFVTSQLPWYIDQIWRGNIIRISNLDELPAEAVLERESAKRIKTQSNLALPLKIGDGVVGALTMATERKTREWPDELVTRLLFVAEMLSNVLARKRAADRLRRQQEELAHVGRVAAMGELAAIIAHELNQPLTAILNNAQAMRRCVQAGRVDPAETDDALGDIVGSASRAGEIIRRLRNLLIKGEPSRAAVDLGQVFLDIEPIVRVEAREYEVAIDLDLAQSLPLVDADAIQLQQVLLNLTGNACHTMERLPRGERRLAIRSWRGPDGEVGIDVTDNGLPPDDATFSRMFEPFFTTKSSGMGMGLTISRSIIESHGGLLSASRNAPRGVTMRVALRAEPRDVPKKILGSKRT